jgi:hypothetical protein
MDTMAHREWCLRPGEGLNNNEYLRSKNGLFYAVMQEDGNFVIYRGDWWESLNPGSVSMWSLYGVGNYRDKLPHLPRKFSAVMQGDGNFIVFTDVVHRQGDAHPSYLALWDTWRHLDRQDRGDNYWAVMQDDGNLCIKRNGDINTTPTFCTGVTDSLAKNTLEPTEVVYDFKNAIVTPMSGPPKRSSRSTAINKTEINQSSTLSLAYTESTASGWKTTSTLKIGLKVAFKLGVPATGEGSVEASSEFTRAWELNETTTKSEAKTISLPVVVPPGKGVIGQVTWSESTITLPFRLKGMGTFNSGIKAPISLNGMYEGIATTDVITTWIPYTEKEEASARATLLAAPSTVLP